MSRPWFKGDANGLDNVPDTGILDRLPPLPFVLCGPLGESRIAEALSCTSLLPNCVSECVSGCLSCFEQVGVY